MFLSFFRLSLQSLLYRKARSLLAILGIIIAIAVVIALLFLGQGLRDSVSNQMAQFGKDLVFVFPGDISNPFTAMFGAGKLKEKHAKAIERLEEIEFVMPTIESRLVIGEFKGEKKTASLHIQPWRAAKEIFEKSQGFRLEAGRWPEKEDAREVVLGSKAAEKLFKTSLHLYDEIILKGRRFAIAGILKELGEQGHDNSIYISMEMFERLTGEKGNFNALIVKVAKGFTPNEAVPKIEKEIIEQKGVDDFSVLTSEKAGDIAGEVIGIIQLVLVAIAAIAVIVGGIGIMNTMYTSVLERRREIGIMKAMGASQGKIITLFLIESALLGIVGGALGAVGGALLAKSVEWYAQNKGFVALLISLNPGTIFLILFFTIITGLVSGILPARSAARMNPAEAISKR